MKKADIVTVVIVAVAGLFVSFIVSNILMGDPDLKTESYKTIKVIKNNLKKPDDEVFNPEAVNPTVEVKVGTCVDLDQNGILDEAEIKACELEK